MRLITNVNYYDQEQKNSIEGRIDQGDVVKFHSKHLNDFVFICKDEEIKAAFLKSHSRVPVYLPWEFTKIKDYNPDQLRQYHKQKKEELNANTGNSSQECDIPLPTNN